MNDNDFNVLVDSRHQTLRSARTAHEKDLTGVAFQATEQVLCDVLLHELPLYRFLISQRNKKQFQAPETSHLAAEAKKLLIFMITFPRNTWQT